MHDTEIIGYFQRWCGYMLTGSVEEEQLVFGYGIGQNGKSVLANTLSHVMGSYAIQADSSILASTKRNSGAASPEIARLAGKRLALLNETKAGEQWDDARMKSLISREKIVARGLHKEHIEFMPTAKFFIRGNNRPNIGDTTDGMWRRIIMLPFLNKVPPEKVDRNLEKKLRDEAEGILAWMVQGCLAWHREGLNAPASIIAGVEQYRRDEDPVSEWIEARIDNGGFTSRSALLSDYSSYMLLPRQTDPKPLYQQLRDKGFNEVKNNGQRGFRVSLRPAQLP